MHHLLEWWFSNRWLTFGAGPVLAANVGIWPIGLFLEWYIRLPSVSPRLVAWKGSKGGGRLNDVEETQKKVPFSKQLFSAHGAVMTAIGPTAIVGGAISSVLLHALVGMAWPEPTLSSLLWQFLVMYVVGDFGLYWGHRVQHEVAYLYNAFHSVHHTIHTPTPLGAIYIDSVDATLQASLPILLGVAAARPHPLAAYAYIAYRVAENIVNHSGLDDSFLDVLFLKIHVLGRAKASHHDAHHKYGARGVGRPMNLGEGFWIWDWAFGTLADRKSLRAD